MSAHGNDNDDANSNNIIFTRKDTTLYVLVVTLSVKDNQKLSKLLGKESERSVYWNEYKTKSENRNPNQDDNAKSYKVKRYYFSKGVIKNYNVIINRANVYDRPVDSNIKR